MQGSFLETCNCETACPCIWLQPPTKGDRKLMVAWHIEQGHLGDQVLKDLHVAMACYSPGGNWQAALYSDERADDNQYDVIVQIFSDRQGEHPAILMSFVSEVLGVKKVKIDYQGQGNKRQLNIPGLAQADVGSIQGITGGQTTINTPPLCIVTSHPTVVAKSKNYQ